MSDAEETPAVYVKRNPAGEIISLSLEADTAHPEALPRDAAELQAFVHQFDVAGSLARTDTDMSRVLEDLIDLLIHNDLIRFTDLPEPAQAKLLKRRNMRRSLTRELLSDDEGLI